MHQVLPQPANRGLPRLIGLALIAALLGCATPPPTPEPTPAPAIRATLPAAELAEAFDGHHGTFVLFDPKVGSTLRHDRPRARTRYHPASTFKIANTLIALETGVADGPDFALPFDTDATPPQPWWPEVWAQDHTLRTALEGSVVWYYQALARRIGEERMADHLRRFRYGNADIRGGIDAFWLTGALRISAEEQVQFLRRFHAGELGVSPETTRLVKEMLLVEETPAYRLSGKTGWAGFGGDEPGVGWWVGYLERGDDVYFFALNLDMTSDDAAAARLSIARDILGRMGLLAP